MARKSRKGLVETVEKKENKVTYPTAVYVRLSIENSGKEDEGASIENQKKVCLDYLMSHPDLQLYDIYEDNGKKGTNMDRPEFNRMLEDLRNGKATCVLVKDLSRFSRDYIDAGNYLEKVFPFMGVRFISVTDSFDSFSANADQNALMIPMKNMLNAAYAKDISRKIITSFRARQSRCEILPSCGPYGYVKSKEVAYRYELDSETAPFAKLIFEMILDGKTIGDVIRKLNELGAPTPAARKLELGIWHDEKHARTRWNNKTITDMLRNPTYTGSIVYGRMPKSLADGIQKYWADSSEWRIFRDMHEPIVSWEQFEKVQEYLKERSRKHKSKVTASKKRLDKIVDPFKGKIFCGDCGKRMRFMKGHKSSADKYVPRYACSRYLDSWNKECSRHSISTDEVEKAVLMALKEQQSFLEQHNVMKELSPLKWNLRFVAQMTANEKRLEQVSRQRYDLFERYADGKLEKDEYMSVKKSIDEEYEELEREQKRLRREERQKKEVVEGVKGWMNILEKSRSKKKLTADLIEQTVERIDIYEEKRMDIRFKFKEERERLKQILAEMEEENTSDETDDEEDDELIETEEEEVEVQDED